MALDERERDPVGYARKVALARRIVLSLAAFVGLTLVAAGVLGLYHQVTERPAKELFGFQGDPQPKP